MSKQVRGRKWLQRGRKKPVSADFKKHCGEELPCDRRLGQLSTVELFCLIYALKSNLGRSEGEKPVRTPMFVCINYPPSFTGPG